MPLLQNRKISELGGQDQLLSLPGRQIPRQEAVPSLLQLRSWHLDIWQRGFIDLCVYSYTFPDTLTHVDTNAGSHSFPNPESDRNPNPISNEFPDHRTYCLSDPRAVRLPDPFTDAITHRLTYSGVHSGPI
jgi:hypothetical protein